jgi:hypothetical protein
MVCRRQRARTRRRRRHVRRPPGRRDHVGLRSTCRIDLGGVRSGHDRQHLSCLVEASVTTPAPQRLGKERRVRDRSRPHVPNCARFSSVVGGIQRDCSPKPSNDWEKRGHTSPGPTRVLGLTPEQKPDGPGTLRGGAGRVRRAGTKDGTDGGPYLREPAIAWAQTDGSARTTLEHVRRSSPRWPTNEMWDR